MIKALVTALVLLVGVGVASLYYRSTLPDPAVSQVLSQCAEAKERFSFTAKNGRRMVRGGPYTAAIRKIDLSACPKEFQAAWSNYRDAWGERLKEQKAKESEFLIDVGVAVASEVALHGMGKKFTGEAVNAAINTAKKPVQDTHFEWSEVKKCAVICNCKMPVNIDDF